MLNESPKVKRIWIGYYICLSNVSSKKEGSASSRTIVAKRTSKGEEIEEEVVEEEEGEEGEDIAIVPPLPLSISSWNEL